MCKVVQGFRKLLQKESLRTILWKSLQEATLRHEALSCGEMGPFGEHHGVLLGLCRIKAGTEEC